MSGRGIEVLFRPSSFGSATLRNRIVMAPMSRYQAPEGIPTERSVAYYRRRAAGGVGLIISEATNIDHTAANGYRDVPNFYGREALAGWGRIREAVHREGARMIPQLWHVGAVRRPGLPPDPSVPGLGPVEVVERGERVVLAMRDEDVAEVCASFARSAGAARDFGFDGVAIHGAHGYLLDQFLWEKSNQRQDRYAGSPAARCRFAAEVVGTMRRAVGSDFPIVFRFSQWKMHDYEARIASSPDELATILGILVEAGVDVFDVSTRRFWLPAFDGDPRSLAAWTRHLSGKCVIAVGSIGLDKPHQSKVYRTATNVAAEVADLSPLVEALERGDFDLAAVGRAILAEPDWARKVQRGALDQIAPYTAETMKTYV